MAEKSSKGRMSFMGRRLGRLVGGKNNSNSTTPTPAPPPAPRTTAPSSSSKASAASSLDMSAAGKLAVHAPAAKTKAASTQTKAAAPKDAAHSTQTTHAKPAPPSASRIKKKKRMRSMNNGNSRNSATSVTEPTARALQKQQNEQQRLQNQLSVKEVESSTKLPIHKQLSQTGLAISTKSSRNQQQPEFVSIPTAKGSATTNTSSAAGMRQRLQELQAMIAAGKDEMEQLKAAECVKIQAIVRGFLQTRRYQKIDQQPTKEQQETTPTTPKTNSRKPCHAVAKKNTITSDYENNIMTPKRKKKKVKKLESDPSSTKPALSKGTTSPTLSAADLEKRKTFAATRIQALARVYCKRQKTRKLATKGAKQKKERKKASPLGVDAVAANQSAEMGEAALKSDHYAWEGGVNGDEDRYAWNGDLRTDKGKDNGLAAATYKATMQAKKGKLLKSDSGAHHHSSCRSLTNEQINGIKDGSKQKAKSSRTSRIKSNENRQAKSGMKEYSWKDHSLKDHSAVPELTSCNDSKDSHQSIENQSTADHSRPSHEFLVDDKKESWGIITNPEVNEDIVGEEDGFEDSDHREILGSSSHTSRRSSIASSFVSKLTELEDETSEDGSLTSKDFSGALGVQQGSEVSEGEREPDLLDLSVMATAPIKHMPLELTETDLCQSGLSKKHHYRSEFSHEEPSVSVMASRNGAGTDADDVSSEDDSLASYAYQDNTALRKRRHHLQDTCDSVMAVVELSGLEVEPEFELEDYDTEYDEDHEKDKGDLEDSHSDTVRAVADDYDFECDDEHLDASVVSNAREDDMSITSPESDQARQQGRYHFRRRQSDLDGEEEIIDTEEISVMSTAINNRHGKNIDVQKEDRMKRELKKSTRLSKPKPYSQFLLPQYRSDSSEEESYLHRKRRQRRSRRSMTKKGNKPCQSHKHVLDREDEEELHQRLAEVNVLIEESQKEIEELMEVECIKIQSFLKMHQKRKMMHTSGYSIPDLKHALSRAGTKEMNAAAIAIQCLARGNLARSPTEVQRRSRKRSRRNRKHRKAQELERKANEQEAQLKERQQELDLKMKRCKQAMEKEKAIMLQAMMRGCLVRSKDYLNAETIAAAKIQRMARATIRVAQLQKRLAAIPEQTEEQLHEILDKKKKIIDEFKPGKFDDVGTRVKMVNFLKKQIEKENETTEKWVTKIKALKENNVRLMTSNSVNVCTVERLRMDVQTKEDKRDTMMKLSQQWIDGIKEYQNRVQTVNYNTKVQQWQMQCCRKYSSLIVDTLDTRYPVKKLVKETKKFLLEHRDAS